MIRACRDDGQVSNIPNERRSNHCISLVRQQSPPFIHYEHPSTSMSDRDCAWRRKRRNAKTRLFIRCGKPVVREMSPQRGEKKNSYCSNELESSSCRRGIGYGLYGPLDGSVAHRCVQVLDTDSGMRTICKSISKLTLPNVCLFCDMRGT